MASFATGSVNFPAQIYENPPDFVEGLAKTMLEYDITPEIEVFDLAMLYNAANLVKKGLLKDPPHVQNPSSPFPSQLGERDAVFPQHSATPKPTQSAATRERRARAVMPSRSGCLPPRSSPTTSQALYVFSPVSGASTSRRLRPRTTPIS